MGKKKNTVSKRTPQDDLSQMENVRKKFDEISILCNKLENKFPTTQTHLDVANKLLLGVRSGVDYLKDVRIDEEINDRKSNELLKLTTYAETLEQRLERLLDRKIINKANLLNVVDTEKIQVKQIHLATAYYRSNGNNVYENSWKDASKFLMKYFVDENEKPFKSLDTALRKVHSGDVEKSYAQNHQRIVDHINNNLPTDSE